MEINWQNDSSETKLKPFNSEPIKYEGQVIYAVIFWSSSVPVKWHAISPDFEPTLAGVSAISLEIIIFNHKQGILAPTKMNDIDLNGEIQSYLAKYAHTMLKV